MIVYKITNKINGKCYIGQTVKPIQRRWKQHIVGNGHCSAIHGAITKYGIDNFDVKIISHNNSIEEMNHRERYYIKLFNSLAPNGYNLTEGGIRPSFSPQARLNMARKGEKHPLWGKKHSEESKKKMSVAKIGKKRSVESNKKQSESTSGSKHWNFGKSPSGETLAKISKNASKQYANGRGAILQECNIQRRIAIICNQNGIIYKSIKSAAISINASASNITQQLKGRARSVKGFTFSYLENTNV